MSEDTAPTEDPKAPTEDSKAPTDDPKDRFRAALERKKNRQHPHESASQNGSKAHGEHGAVGGKRQFRRKSGG